MRFITRAASVTIFFVCRSFLMDLNFTRIATTQANYYILRCALGALGVAVLQPLTDSVGIGWCFAFYVAVGILYIPLLLVVKLKGHRWRGAQAPLQTSTTVTSPADTKIGKHEKFWT